MANFDVEVGSAPPPKRRYTEKPHEYKQGYALAMAKRYLLTPTEYTKQVSEPVKDSFAEGWQDGISGKASKYES